jgi:integrase
MKRKRGEGTVYKRKDGRYEAAVFINTPDGKRRVCRQTHTRSEAEEALVELRGKNNNGLITYTKQPRVGDYLDHWLSVRKAKLKPNTIVGYEVIVRKYLKPGLGDKYVTKLGVRDVQAFIDKQQALGASNRTLQKQKIVLTAALKRAEQEELITRNVARLAEIPTYHPKEIVPWSLNQLQEFLIYSKGDPFHPIFVFLASYGLRTSEALGLSWKDIDFNENVIHVRQQLQYYDQEFHYSDLKTKAAERKLPLLNSVYKELQNIKRTNDGHLPDLIFKTVNSNPVDRRGLLRRFQRLSHDAGLPVIALHHIRHTTATNLKDMGVLPRDNQLILGHANITTTQQIYQHLGLEKRIEILSQYEQVLAGNSTYSRQNQPSNDINTDG